MGAESSSPPKQLHHKAVSPLTATFNCNFSVRTTLGEEKLQIHRVISLPDDRILVVDFINSYVMLFSENYELQDNVKLNRCYAVIYVGDNRVAIASLGTIDEGSDVIHYSLEGNKIKQTEKKIHIEGLISDLAFRDGELIMKYRKDDMMVTYCGSKCIIKQHGGMVPPDFLFYDPVSDYIFLSHATSSSVTCCKPNGKPIWEVTVDGVPAGITVAQGVVLVSDLSDSVIRQITMDGRLMATPLLTEEDGIKGPNTITYQHGKQRLLISRPLEDTFMVFDIPALQQT